MIILTNPCFWMALESTDKLRAELLRIRVKNVIWLDRMSESMMVVHHN
jgi:hypothetical protein